MAGGNLSGHCVVSSQTRGGTDKDSQITDMHSQINDLAVEIAALKKQLAAQQK